MSATRRVYLDFAASTPLDPAVHAAMLAAPAIGNPSSLHAEGMAARRAVDAARKEVALLLEVQPGECHFTGGATEAATIGILGYLRALRQSVGADRILRALVSPLEHSCVTGALAVAERDYGVTVDILPIGKDGIVSASAVRERITPETVLVCVMSASNVLGTLQPVREIGGIVKEVRASRGTEGLPIAFMTDAVQALRTQTVLPHALGADLLIASAHKIHGPKGVGLLYKRRDLPFTSFASGGGQEAGVRGGTENVAGIVGFGAAARMLREQRATDARHAAGLRERLLRGIEARLGSRSHILGDASGAQAVPDIVFLRIDGHDAETVAVKLDVAGFAVATGSACETGTRSAPPIIRALYGDRVAKDGGIRMSYGRATTEADIDAFVDALAVIAR